MSNSKNVDVLVPPVSYVCPKHGDLGTVVMNIKVWGNDKQDMDINYCIYCLIEKYDEIGVERVTVKDLTLEGE